MKITCTFEQGFVSGNGKDVSSGRLGAFPMVFFSVGLENLQLFSKKSGVRGVLPRPPAADFPRKQEAGGGNFHVWLRGSSGQGCEFYFLFLFLI